MSERPYDTITNDLLARYFAGECSVEESHRVEDWATATQENRDTLKQSWVAWIDTGRVEEALTVPADYFDVDKAWSNVKAMKSSATRTSSAYGPGWWLRMAAMLAIGIGLALTIRTLFFSVGDTSVLAEKEVRELILSDSSQVTLNVGSKLTYSEDFGENRVVSLAGEAFFEVEHDPRSPFQVEVEEIVITVLGTSFNVSALSMQDTVAVFVASGLVSMASEAEELVLSAGQKGVFVRSSQSFVSIADVPVGVDTFWKTQRLRYDGHALSDVVRSLEAVYGRRVILADDVLRDCRLTVTFGNESLEDILEVIGLTLNLEVVQDGDAYVLSGEGC